LIYTKSISIYFKLNKLLFNNIIVQFILQVSSSLLLSKKYLAYFV
jgi:hypothetical protein